MTADIRCEFTDRPSPDDLDVVDSGLHLYNLAAVIYLDTFSFQAPEFYRCCGYRAAARIDGFPDAIGKFLMVKRLGAGAIR